MQCIIYNWTRLTRWATSIAWRTRAAVKIATNGKDLDDLIKRAGEATGRADALVTSLNDMTSPRGDLQASLRDLAASASSLRGLTHDLERNPLGTLLRRSE